MKLRVCIFMSVTHKTTKSTSNVRATQGYIWSVLYTPSLLKPHVHPGAKMTHDTGSVLKRFYSPDRHVSKSPHYVPGELRRGLALLRLSPSITKNFYRACTRPLIFY